MLQLELRGFKHQLHELSKLVGRGLPHNCSDKYHKIFGTEITEYWSRLSIGVEIDAVTQ